MEIATQDVKQVELITIKGRVDSVEAVKLSNALQSASRREKHSIVVDMSQVEYMSSAGFRALGDAQRRSQRYGGCEVILVQVPDLIREALEIVGFTEYFRIMDSVSSALEFVENLPGQPDHN